jgi:hypothetical protein
LSQTYSTLPTSVSRINATAFLFNFEASFEEFTDFQLVLATKYLRFHSGQLAIDTHSIAFYRIDGAGPLKCHSERVADIFNRNQELHCAALAPTTAAPVVPSTSLHVLDFFALPASTSGSLDLEVALSRYHVLCLTRF